MAALVTGVVTNIGRERLAKSFGNVAGFPICRAKYFKIGEGGFIIDGDNRIPKDPSPALTNVEATGAPGDFFFQKNFVSTDFTFLSPSIMQLRCRLNPLEANDDGTADSPRFFEIGIFDDTNAMIIYTTFPEQTKQSNKILTNYIQVYF